MDESGQGTRQGKGRIIMNGEDEKYSDIISPGKESSHDTDIITSCSLITAPWSVMKELTVYAFL